MMVKMILARIESFQARLHIHIRPFVFPLDLRRFLRIEVDPDESKLVDVDMHAEERIGRFVKAFEILVVWSLCKLAVQTVRPIFAGFQPNMFTEEIRERRLTVILAGKDRHIASVFLNDRVGPMSTDIVVGVDTSVSVFDDQDWVASNLRLDIVSSIREAQLMGHQDPLSGEDRALFELKHLGRCVP